MSHMSTQDNKAIIRSLIDGLFTEGDLGAVDAYLAPTLSCMIRRSA